jgi:hypothetical protein
MVRAAGNGSASKFDRVWPARRDPFPHALLHQIQIDIVSYEPGSSRMASDRSQLSTSAEHYLTLADEMSPYFVGPMPVVDFLSEFLPPSELSLPQVVPSFTQGMFTPVVTQDEEVEMYDLFVCP